MRERVRCRDFGDGERIFVTDWEKILYTLVAITSLFSFASYAIGLAFDLFYLSLLGLLGLVTIFVILFFEGRRKENETY